MLMRENLWNDIHTNRIIIMVKKVSITRDYGEKAGGGGGGVSIW